MAVLDHIELPNGITYDISDASARKLDNNDFDTINVTELNAGDVIVTGAARFLNTINGDISGNAETATSATKATQDESGNNIKNTYASSFSISDHTITLKNKNGTSLGTVTVPDNNTTYTVATGTANGKIKVTPSSGSAYEVSVYGLKSAAYKDVTDSYSATGTDPVSGKAVAAALGTLDGPISGTAGASKTLTAFSQTDGKVSATFGNISITKSQVSDFPTSMTPTSHTHGNIQNGGTLQTDDITIASGDKLVVTDSSDSSKVARTSISFDGSTANKCLTQKGTWESFTNNTGTVTSVKVGSTSYSPSSGVVSLPAYPTTLPASDTTSTYSATGTAPVNGTAVAEALTTKADTSDAIKNITRSGTTFTATRADGTTFTFTQQDNNTTYSAGTALTLSGTTINHDDYGTAGTAGTGSATHGSTLSVPYVKVNAQGHVTAWGAHTHTVNGLQYQTDNVSRVVMMSDGQVSVQTKGYLSCNNYANTGFKPMSASAFNVSSSRKVKENIKPITNEEAYKLLEVNPVSFDYIEQVGGDKNQFGVIAEEVNETIPFVVSIPENYDEESEDYMHVPSVDYSKFVPHMIKLIQLQEEKIESMNQEIEKLKSFVDQT